MYYLYIAGGHHRAPNPSLHMYASQVYTCICIGMGCNATSTGYLYHSTHWYDIPTWYGCTILLLMHYLYIVGRHHMVPSPPLHDVMYMCTGMRAHVYTYTCVCT